MAMSIGTLTVAGTTVVAALAVGAAVGVHTLVGTPGGRPSANLAMSDDFCTLMGQTLAYGVNGGAPLAEMTSTVDAVSDNEAVTLAVLHAQGKQIIDAVGPLAAIERHAAGIVTDPQLSRAFEASAKSLELTAATFGTLARDAQSADGFLAQIMTAASDPETAAVGTAGDEANAIIIAYVGAECGISLDGKAITATKPSIRITEPAPGATASLASDPDASAVAAMADASQIGEILNLMFAEWSEGDPLPVVDLVDGFYSVDDGAGNWSGFSASSNASVIADVFIVGPSDWCVSVTVTRSPPATYSFSAQNGLAEGVCG